MTTHEDRLIAKLKAWKWLISELKEWHEREQKGFDRMRKQGIEECSPPWDHALHENEMDLRDIVYSGLTGVESAEAEDNSG